MSAVRRDIKEEMAGRWASVLQSVGYDAGLFSGKHQSCPCCQAGKDRARWDRQREFLICSQCGAHQPLELAMEQLGMSYKDTVNYIRPNMGSFKMEAVKTNEPDLEKRKERLKGILKGCKPITADCAAARYFAGRCITELPEADCFYHPALVYFDSEGKNQGVHPALVSRIRTPEGEISSFQVLYLTQDGKKLDAPDCRKILPVIAPMTGGAIRLYPATDILCIAEGLETAMSARKDTGMPVWSAVNAGNMEKIVIPETVKHIYIYADMDKKTGTGIKFASSLYSRLLMKGDRETVNLVIFNEQKQIVLKPEDYDMNDYIILQAAA